MPLGELTRLADPLLRPTPHALNGVFLDPEIDTIACAVSEPYHQLDPSTRDRAIDVLLGWAIRQKHRRRPFLEFIDGTAITPMDLLVELPPTTKDRYYRARLTLIWRSRLRFRARKPRAWPHVLNLIAISATHGDDDIDVLLDQIEGRVEAEGSTGPSAA